MNEAHGPAHQIARYLAERSRPQTLRSIIEGMGFEEIHRSTVWRWIKAAQDAGLVEMQGDKKSSIWNASEEMRRMVLREQLSEPLAKKALVPYEEGFLEEYEPNKTMYLSKRDIERMHAQCPVGSAEFSKLIPRDQSLFFCGLPYASSSLEGNGYDLIATENLLINGIVKEGASIQETTMVRNHYEAARFLIDNIHFPSQRNDVMTSMMDIKSIHGLLSTNLLKNPAMCGSLRRTPVRINQSAYIPLSVPESIERAFSIICDKASKIEDPFEQAFFLTVHLPYLQPFEDCNKRTARVACNIPLLRRGVVPMSWMDVSHEDYTNGIMGIYEHNNTTLLSEVFVDGYLHSSARFEQMKKEAIPNEVETRYRGARKQLVRSIVLDNNTTLPDEVRRSDLEPFRVYVEQELGLLRAGNIGALRRNNLKEGDVEIWLRENEELDSAPVERVRG